jgi:uncharacterized protein (DUF2141 family)
MTMWKFLGAGLFSLMFSTVAATAADLTVTINGVKNSNGSVAAALFNSEADFRKTPFSVFWIKASGGPVSFTVHNLPPGKYAITSYHDENDNGKLDADPVGSPTEGYGVSNDAREAAAPPQFSKAAFDVGDQEKSIAIKITY